MVFLIFSITCESVVRPANLDGAIYGAMSGLLKNSGRLQSFGDSSGSAVFSCLNGSSTSSQHLVLTGSSSKAALIFGEYAIYMSDIIN